MKRAKTVLWGIVLVAVGVLFCLEILDVLKFSLLFDGWWTLFIIIPSVIGIFTDKEKLWAIIGTLVGGILLLSAQDVIKDDAIFKLIIPVIIVLIGLKMIFKEFFDKGAKKAKEKIAADGSDVREYAAVFSGQELNCAGQEFKAAELNAIFGGLDLDLRGAVITEDAVINVCAVFGGIDILVPDNVNVRITSNSIFGGIDDERGKMNVEDGRPTVYVSGTCIFGGVDIK